MDDNVARSLPVYSVIADLMKDPKVSDISIATDEPVAFQKNSEMHDTDYFLSEKEYYDLCSAVNIKQDDGNVIIDGMRGRTNRTKHFYGEEIVLRPFPLEIPSTTDIRVPDHFVQKFLSVSQGVIFVCGATGSGKSTTIASCVQERALQKAERIITVEDPIEIVYPKDTKAQIRQKEYGEHFEDFNKGLVAALRQKPNVIVVGEIRDGETAEIALKAAETGHLVVTTLHTNSVVEAFDRLYAEMDATGKQLASKLLSKYLAGIICQRLYPSSVTGGRVAVHQCMYNNIAVANCISKSDEQSIKNLRGEFKQNHYTYKKSLAGLLRDRLISAEDNKMIVEDLLINGVE